MIIDGGRLRVTGGEGACETRVGDGALASSAVGLWNKFSREVLPAPLGPSRRKQGVKEALLAVV